MYSIAVPLLTLFENLVYKNKTMRLVSAASFFIAIFFLSLPSLHSLDINISNKELGVNIRGEYNRTFYYCQDHAIFAGIELNNRYMFKTGFALGTIGGETDIKAFGNGQFNLFTDIPLNLHIAYIYYGIPGFEMQSHSILPFISYTGKRAGIMLGINLRNTSFFGESPIFESILSFSVYLNIINTDTFLVSIKCENFNDFYAGNFGSYSLNLNGALHINDNWSLIAAIDLLQSGSETLAANFYGIAFMGGIRYKW